MRIRTILLIGYFRPTKGFHRIVQVFPRILKKVPGAGLVIAGNFKRGRHPVYRRDFYQLVRESPAAGRIILKKGPFSKERYARFIDEADLVVLPYEAGAHEHIIRDAYARGVPVVASDLPGFVRFVKKRGGGVIVHNDEELIKAIVSTLKKLQNKRSKRKRLHRKVAKGAKFI
jgi:glycosyltransferase involved in cell wall biosynthesis